MPLNSTLSIEQSPKFASLSYAEQQKLRSFSILKDLKENYPAFSQLSEVEQQKLLHAAVTSRKPVYKDQSFAQTADQLVSQIEQGDKRALATLNQNISTRAAMNSGLIASALAHASVKFNDWISNDGMRGEYMKYVTSDFLRGSDSDKFYAYVSQNLFRDKPEVREKWSKLVRAQEITSSVGGFAVDMAAMWGVTQAALGTKLVTGATKGLSQATIAARAAERIGPLTAKIGNWTARIGIPALTDALVGGAYGVARENMIALATGDTDRLTNDVKEFGRAFGEFAAWDLAISMALPTALSFFGGLGKRISKGADDLVRGRMSDVEYQAMLKNFEAGKLSKMQLEQLSDIGQDIYMQNQALRTLGDKVEDLNNRPLLRAQVDANSNGYYIRQLDDGKIRLTQIKETTVKGRKVPNYVTDTYDSLLDAEVAMSNDIIRKYKGWSPKQQNEFLQNPANARLFKMGATLNNVNEQLDPLYKMDLDDAARKTIKEGRNPDFISPVRRPTITHAEADELVKNSGSMYVAAGTPEDLAAEIKKTGRRFLKTGQTHTFEMFKGQPNMKRGVVPINTPAMDEAYQYAGYWADEVLKLNPTIRESRENLRALFLLENGFDSHIKRAPDGSILGVETFLPNRVRIVSEATKLAPTSKVDITNAPRSVRVNNAVQGISKQGDTLITNESEAHRYLGNFTNKRKLKNLKQIMATENFKVYKSSYGKFQVDIPEVGVSKQFNTLKDAETYAKRNWSKIGNVLEEAQSRAIPVTIEDGAYKFLTPDGKPVYARTEDEVKAFFRNNPEPEDALEIFEEFQPGFTDEFEDAIMSMDQSMVPRATMTTDLDAPTNFIDAMDDGDVRLSIRQQLGRLVTQTDAWVEDVVQTQNLPELGSSYNNMRRAVRIKNGQYHQAIESVYSDIFTTKTGTKYWKPKYRDRRRLIYYYIAGQGKDTEAKRIYNDFIQKIGDITEEEIDIANRLMATYDAWGKRFGVPARDMIDFYQPRARAFVSNTSNAELLRNSPLIEDVLPSMYGGGDASKVPREINAFFLEERTADALQFLVEDDAMFALLKYIDKGLAVEHVKPAWTEMQRTLRTIGNENISDHMFRYASKALNSFQTSGDKLMGDIGRAFADNINKVKKGLRGSGKPGRLPDAISPNEGANMMNTLYTLNYLTNMAYRPWLAIRNGFQIWTTLAPRMGNEVVGEAVRKTHTQILKDDKLIEGLRTLGVLDRKPPIRGELGGLGTRLNRLSQKAFSMFKGSDDYTRLIAYNVGDTLMDRSFNAIRRGDIDLNTRGGKNAFLEVSGLRKTDPNLAEELFQRTKRAFAQGEDAQILSSVKLTWGQKLIDDTMFIYDAAQSPAMFDGVVGKAFGRYGTYSVGYRANMWRGLKYGSASDKLGFITRFIGNQAALWATFSALGIKATNFIPGQPAVFTGGPMFDLMITALRSTDTSSYGGRQARGELGNALQQLVPGSLQYQYLKKAIQYIDEGDTWRAFLSLTSTPVTNGPFLRS